MNLAPLALLLLFLVACVLWRRERSRAQQLLRERASIRLELEQSFEERRALARSGFIAEERERIYADLHDDIGARLLGLIHSSPAAPQAELARTILQDLRDVVSRSRGAPGTLLDALSEIRSEAAQRLDTLGGALDWQQADDLPAPQLDQGQALHLLRIVREALSNALEHGQAPRIRIRIRIRVRRSGPMLVLDVTDAGTLGGTKVVLQFPLPDAAATD